MARPVFKKWWTKLVPTQVERSTYVMFTNVVLILLFWQWRPMTEVIWDVENTYGAAILCGLFWLGWLTVFLSTFMINHFDLFGLRQVYLYFQKKEYTNLEFKTNALYNYCRHPIMLGFIIAFWATPQMTVGHLLFAAATTIYILIAIQFEERDLLNSVGDSYTNYRRQVSMLIPWKRKKD